MDHRSDLMSAKSKFGNGPECQLRGVGGSSGQAVGDANESGRSLQQWPHQAATSAITSGSSYSRSGSTSAAGRSGSSTSAAAAGAGCGSSQSRQVVASAEGMHAAVASKSTSWRTPATGRCVLPAFS